MPDEHDRPDECSHVGDLRAFLADSPLTIFGPRRGRVYVECPRCGVKVLVDLKSK